MSFVRTSVETPFPPADDVESLLERLGATIEGKYGGRKIDGLGTAIWEELDDDVGEIGIVFLSPDPESDRETIHAALSEEYGTPERYQDGDDTVDRWKASDRLGWGQLVELRSDEDAVHVWVCDPAWMEWMEMRAAEE